ncbi:hypothetical protein ZHAS_00005719 [Anopheles sinensis]|uniref:BHLH domain-containing protein n=1 Tax=Anopheles sinensis TaxID=74873 RepID=A0A084VK70_ANOSI|nr:hypothetical protein ZHAS_00005719 [Anopheles sinensis]
MNGRYAVCEVITLPKGWRFIGIYSIIFKLPLKAALANLTRYFLFVPFRPRLGPCELPLSDQWLVHTQLSQSAQPSQASFYSSPAGGQGLGGLGGLSANTTLPIQQHSSGIQQQQQLSQNQIGAPQSGAATAATSGAAAPASQQLQSQSKIMNVVVPSVACPPTASKKIRRKPDTKPQSQINKCNNEKRRRELENEYIEQLGEFLQIKRDMTACKPDKAAILSEVVRTFRHMIEQGNPNLTGSRCSKCSPDCSASCKLHPVQQGEVSSTEPPLPEPSVNGHSPEKSAYFEAVQHYISNVGWALLEINSEGVIECATENVRDVLHYSRTELHGQSIYSYLHTGDHSKLSPILNKNSIELNWDQNEMFYQTPKRTIRTKIRWLLRAPESANETIEQKQQRLEKYKDLLIISAPVKDDTEESSSVLCLITLPEDEQATIETTTMPQTLDEQLTLKLDINGNIINYDASTLRKQFAGNLTKETIRSIYDLCHTQDRPRLIEHIGSVRSANGTPLELTYRLRLGSPDAYVHVKSQSKLFRCTKPNETDFIMAICTVLTENEVAMLSADGGAAGSLAAMGGGSNINSNSNTSGSSNSNPTSSSSLGLLMPSTSSSMATGGGGLNNGGNVDVVARHMAQITQGVSNMGGPLMSSVLNGGQGAGSGHAPPGMLGAGPGGGGGGGNMAGANMGMMGGNNTPGTPGLGGGNGVGGGGGMGSGMSGSSTLGSIVSPRSNMNSSSVVCGPSSDSFFSTEFELEFPHSTFEMEQVGVSWDSRPDSRASVTPVSTPRPPSVSAYSPAAAPMCASPMTPTQVQGNGSVGGVGGGGGGGGGVGGLGVTLRPGNETSKSGSNNMLLQLLNDKSDDDDSDIRNRQGSSELLKQLQKVKDEPKEHNPPPLNNEELMQILRVQSNDRKRPSTEPDEGSAVKRSDTRPSKLREKNKMLASLLANPAKAPMPMQTPMPFNRIIPDIPNSGMARQLANVSSSTAPPNQTLNNNNLTTSNNNLKQDAGIGSAGGGGGAFATSTPATSTQLASEWDPELNEILNHVIEIAPDDFAESELNSLNPIESSTSSVAPSQSSQPDIHEKLAINAIQKSLMQYENVSSPMQQPQSQPQFSGSPPAYPLHAAMAGGAAGAGSGSTSGGNSMGQSGGAGGTGGTVVGGGVGGTGPAGSSVNNMQQQQPSPGGPNQNFTPPPVYTQRMRLPSGPLVSAPNVTLTRANNVPDSQLSPGFSPNLMQQQLSPSQRTQLSPQQTGFQGNPFNNNPGHRLSPQLQQMVSGFGNAGGNVNQQLSPRQPPFGGGAMGFNPAANRQFVGPPQRQRNTLNSPGTPRQQNTFGGTMVDGGGFPGPPSPSPVVGVSAPNFANTVFANQQMRLQRQGSVPPQATQHLPGSPRSAYGGHGPGPDATGYGMMFGNAAAMQQHTAGSPGDFFNRGHTGLNGGIIGGGNGIGGGGGNGGLSNGQALNQSELVRQELRAIVSGRAQRPPSHGTASMGLSPLGALSLGSANEGGTTGGGGGGGVGLGCSTVVSSNGGTITSASPMLGSIGGPGRGGGSGVGGGGGRSSAADTGASGMLGLGGSSGGNSSSAEHDPTMLYNFQLNQKG